MKPCLCGRAEMVRDILIKEHNISEDRIEAVGKGESEPLADKQYR